MKRKMSRLNEELIRKSNLDIPKGPVKVDGATNPVYTDALNQHAKREKEVADMLKDTNKVADIDTPFTGSTDKKNMPKEVEEAKMDLDESLFEDVDMEMTEAYEFGGADQMGRAQCSPLVPDFSKSIKDYIKHHGEDPRYDKIIEKSLKGFVEKLQDSKQEVENFNSYWKKRYPLLIQYIDEQIALIPFDVIDIDESTNESVSKRKHIIKEAVAERDTEINKDMWSCIYNELCGEIKNIEAPYRRFKRKPKERYSSDELGVGMNDEIIVRSNTEEGLDFAKEVADEYGVEFEIFERKSMYAPAKFEMFIYPDKPAMNESLLKESNNSNTYSIVAKHFDYSLPEDTNEVLADLVERAVLNAEDGQDLYDATMEAVDEGLIYTKDIWAIKSYYEDATLEDRTYEALYDDIQSIASELIGMDESLKTSLKEDFMFEPMSLEDAKKLYDTLKQEEPSAIVKNAMSDIWFFTDGLTKDYRNNKSDKTNESLKESYTEVDTIECGEETYRVVGGGFNTRDALVSVEDSKGNKKRLSSGDVIEFYTWYDKKGNVIHEPSDDEE